MNNHDSRQPLATLLRPTDLKYFYGQRHLLAAGKIDAVIESDVNILDIAALVAIVTEAGGRFTELGGAPISLGSKSVLATNELLHPLILNALT